MFANRPNPDPIGRTDGDLDYPALPPLPADMVVFAKVGIMQLERTLKRHAEFDEWLTAHGERREFA